MNRSDTLSLLQSSLTAHRADYARRVAKAWLDQSPNDLAMKSDGSIWFTDPGYDSGLALPPPTGSTVPRGFQPGL